MAGVHSVEWKGERAGQEGPWEARQRWENGDRPTATATSTAEGATGQKLLFADTDDALVLFILGRSGRRPLLAPISVIMALHWQKQVIVLCICRGAQHKLRQDLVDLQVILAGS